jgi:lambda repressor-like predicted transcriptional regulator
VSERTLQTLKNALARPCVVSRIVKAEWLAVALMAVWCGGVLVLALSSALR